MIIDLRTYHLYRYFKILKSRAGKSPEEQLPGNSGLVPASSKTGDRGAAVKTKGNSLVRALRRNS